MELCLCCGAPARFGIADLYYETREIVLDACCEANRDGWLDEFAHVDRRERVDWVERHSGLKVRDVIVDGISLSWVLDYGLELKDVAFSEAKAFVNEHHRHNVAPIGWKFGACVYNGDEIIGVVMAGRPVSAALQRQGCLEINRNCVKACSPKGLAWNACSFMYGWACRKAFNNGFRRVITYTLESEDGASLRAAGFVPVARSKGGSWSRGKRPRTDKAPTAPKIRWERWAEGVPVHQLKLPMNRAE